ncbi:2-phosphosulfolactate phosphatase [Pseudomonas sp. PB120]|uniref:2-phosphosulfolactate phosphatase n=1 Tax=Pseudomonas sp. PB120 TaxID=2494700 RepID=UPI0012FE6DD0|nr:2-phosphosulfolactate phosphatase [Pseudomonas sp. PB120]
MPKINVVLRKEDLDPDFLYDKVAVVIDVLFATTTIVAALHHGARAVYPAANRQMACDTVNGLEPDSYILAGENHLQKIPGFVTYSPLALSQEALAGRNVVFSTTNGTVALRKADTAKHVYAAALLNAPAIIRQLQKHQDRSIVLVCSGSAGRVNLEDLYLAGYLVEQLEITCPGTWTLSDTCHIARSVYGQYYDSPHDCLMQSQLGVRLCKEDMFDEVEYSARLGLLDIVPHLQGNHLTCL